MSRIARTALTCTLVLGALVTRGLALAAGRASAAPTVAVVEQRDGGSPTGTDAGTASTALRS